MNDNEFRINIYTKIKNNTREIETTIYILTLYTVHLKTYKKITFSKPLNEDPTTKQKNAIIVTNGRKEKYGLLV